MTPPAATTVPPPPPLAPPATAGTALSAASAPAPGTAKLGTPGLHDDNKEVHEVWTWNFDKEFADLLAAASGEAGGAILALDMEFPGFLRQEPRSGARAVRYQALRENVDRLRPIQLGAAVAGADGGLRGVWSFNLQFNVDVDLHTEKSVAFLRAAGIDFPRHASEGIEATTLGQRLAGSLLVGLHGLVARWVTFSGSYDLGYLLKLLTANRPLPRDHGSFDSALSTFCPRRHELRDELGPHGSLESLAKKFGLQRHGMAHTAGSDALLTLELFVKVVGTKRWNSWANEETWEAQNAWYQGWDPAWDPTRWDNVWGFPFPNPATSLPWLPTIGLSTPVPSLNGGAPMPSASFWGAASQSPGVKVPPVIPTADAAAAARKMGWWLPTDTSKVMEI
mmetsp:Transcript_51906/g.110911  ORF Transcript_51906/g.110911 Transcript_51906/m.110911 type:complete len:394 (+) Transcript_51906:70-1251(+)